MTFWETPMGFLSASLYCPPVETGGYLRKTPTELVQTPTELVHRLLTKTDY